MRRGLVTTLFGVPIAVAATLTPALPGAAAVRPRAARQHPIATLTILTTTIGGVGTFGYIAGPYDDDPTHVSATTQRPDAPVPASPEGNLRLLSTNRYVIQQLPPTPTDGDWSLERVVCNGTRRRVRRQPISDVRYVRLRLTFGRATVCSFIDRFTPAGNSA